MLILKLPKAMVRERMDHKEHPMMAHTRAEPRQGRPVRGECNWRTGKHVTTSSSMISDVDFQNKRYDRDEEVNIVHDHVR